MERKDLSIRLGEASHLVVGQLQEIQHGLDGEEQISGDDRILLLFERTYLQGLVDMAVHLRRDESISDLALLITKERLDCLTGRIETGVLHVHTIGFDVESGQEGEQTNG